MARRRRNRELDIALGVAQLVGVVLLLGLISPQGRQMLSGIGFIAICIVGVLFVGLIGFGVYRFATRSQRAEAVERNVDWQALGVDAKAEHTPPQTSADLIEQLRSIDWFQFEKLVALVYRKLGYTVARRGGANPDGGIDLVIEKDGQRSAVQCKQWKSWNVGVKAVREFLGALTDAGISKGIFITLCGYTGQAKQLADTRFDRVRLWQEIAVALLKKYANAFYLAKKSEWEAPKLEYRDLDPNDPNMVKEYRFLIEKSETEIQMRMNEIKEAVEKKLLKDFDFGKLQTFCFGQHLYQPLVYLSSDVIQVTPVELNEGERNFVLDLRKFHEREKTGFFADKELYLLRNRSKGRGIGFFEAGNFYPDFILWLVFGGKQYVSFVDPKGLRNLEGGIANPKIEFYNTIKKIEKPHLDPNIVLNSFIVTPTRYSDPGWWTGGLTKAQFEARHVFFQKEDPDTYVGKILARVAASTTSAAAGAPA